MFSNYFKIAFRNLWRSKAFSLINIAGLSIGLACCMLIFLYTKDEVSFDRFHEKKSQLFRTTIRVINKQGEEMKMGGSGMVEGPAFKREIPEVEDFVRVQQERFLVKKGNETFNQEAWYVDENFFTVFSFPLIAGDPKKVLSELNSMVLSDETAEKYFGTADAVGKTLALEINGKFEPFVVSGVAKRAPQNSTLKFTILLPFKYNEKLHPDDQWMSIFMNSFLVLNPKANPQVVATKMNRVFATNAKNQLEEARQKGFDGKWIWGLQPFLQIHLSTDYRADNGLSDASNPIYSYILTGIALFILLIACINFVNLTVAQSLKRGKEIGIRKVVGGQRSQLIRQFLGESFILCFLAFMLAVMLTELALPVFNELANKRLAMSYLFDFQLVAGFIGLFLLTGFAAGFYPALVLSGFNPVQTLYNRTRFASRNYLAKSLVVVQFALATFLIISTLFIYAQFDYLTHKQLGYNDKNVAVVELGVSDNKLTEVSEVFENELSKESGV